MRTALATLIAAAGLATMAQAQDAAAPAAAPAMAPQAAPAAPDAAAMQAAPAAPAAAAPAAPAEPPPTLPTSGDGAALIQVIEKVCVPIVRGQTLDAVAKANGYKLNRRDRSWTAPLNADNKAYTITILDQGANKNVCRGEVHYAVGQEDAMVKALNVWSFLHQPQLVLGANYVGTGPDGMKRVRRSWENADVSKMSNAVNFTTVKKGDDTPVGKGYDVAEFFYQERTF